MRKLLFALLPFMCLLAMQAGAQTRAEKEVGTAVENFRKALVSGEKAALQSLASEKLSYGHSSGKVEDKATFVETLASGKSDFVTCDFTNQTVTVSGNTAIVRHHLEAKTNDGGKPGTVSLNIMLVFQKMNGKWILLARQAVKAL